MPSRILLTSAGSERKAIFADYRLDPGMSRLPSALAAGADLRFALGAFRKLRHADGISAFQCVEIPVDTSAAISNFQTTRVTSGPLFDV